MDKDVLKAKLEALSRCIARIKGRTPKSSNELKNDYDLQDIISVNLERAVQVSVDIASHIAADFPEESIKTMGDAFTALAKHNIIPTSLAQNMIKAVGFRNISVHQYQSINWEIVYSIVTKNLTDFSQFAEAIFKKVQ